MAGSDGVLTCEGVCERNAETCSSNGETEVAPGMFECGNGWCVPDASHCDEVEGWSYGVNGEGLWYRTQSFCAPNVTQAPREFTCAEVRSGYQSSSCCSNSGGTMSL